MDDVKKNKGIRAMSGSLKLTLEFRFPANAASYKSLQAQIPGKVQHMKKLIVLAVCLLGFTSVLRGRARRHALRQSRRARVLQGGEVFGERNGQDLEVPVLTQFEK